MQGLGVDDDGEKGPGIVQYPNSPPPIGVLEARVRLISSELTSELITLH